MPRFLTVAVRKAMLLAGLGSVAALPTEAPLITVLLSGAAGLTWTTRTKLALAPAASVPSRAETTPVPPTAGADVVTPVGAVKDTKVVPEGTRSVTRTPWASEGPALVTDRV